MTQVIPPCKWRIRFDDDSSTTCTAQELLLWLRVEQCTKSKASSRASPPIGDNDMIDPPQVTVDRSTSEDVRRGINSDNISGDLNLCEVRKSTIPGAGLGLFATKVIYPNQRIAKYSGKIISPAEAKALTAPTPYM